LFCTVPGLYRRDPKVKNHCVIEHGRCRNPSSPVGFWYLVLKQSAGSVVEHEHPGPYTRWIEENLSRKFDYRLKDLRSILIA
jgi:hypothetical protein